jgi:hypothetical protein
MAYNEPSSGQSQTINILKVTLPSRALSQLRASAIGMLSLSAQLVGNVVLAW